MRRDRRATLETIAARTPGTLTLSALTGEGMEAFLAAITETLDDERTEDTLTIPFTDGRARAWAYDQGIVTGEEQTEEAWVLTVQWTARQKKRWRDEISGPET